MWLQFLKKSHCSFLTPVKILLRAPKPGHQRQMHRSFLPCLPVKTQTHCTPVSSDCNLSPHRSPCRHYWSPACLCPFTLYDMCLDSDHGGGTMCYILLPILWPQQDSALPGSLPCYATPPTPNLDGWKDAFLVHWLVASPRILGVSDINFDIQQLGQIHCYCFVNLNPTQLRKNCLWWSVPVLVIP